MHTFDDGLSPERLPDLAKHAFTGLSSATAHVGGASRGRHRSLDAVALSSDPRFDSPLNEGDLDSPLNEGDLDSLPNEGDLDDARIFDPRTVRRAIEAISTIAARTPRVTSGT
ncbi:MAG: hypothetical protein JWL95_2473 [Gemmatimonadetes bacterium]|nr:hypothetical protein [Gemmatimonadota bacterium]